MGGSDNWDQLDFSLVSMKFTGCGADLASTLCRSPPVPEPLIAGADCIECGQALGHSGQLVRPSFVSDPAAASCLPHERHAPLLPAGR